MYIEHPTVTLTPGVIKALLSYAAHMHCHVRMHTCIQMHVVTRHDAYFGYTNI